MPHVKVILNVLNLNFWQFFGIFNFEFVLLWHGIWYECIVWVIMGQRGYSQNAAVLVVLVVTSFSLYRVIITVLFACCMILCCVYFYVIYVVGQLFLQLLLFVDCIRHYLSQCWYRPMSHLFNCSSHRIIMKFSGVMTNDRSDVHTKGQGQMSKIKVTEVKTQLSRFRTITPVWNHNWWWNDIQNLMLLRRGALLIFKVIRQISRSHG